MHVVGEVRVVVKHSRVIDGLTGISELRDGFPCLLGQHIRGQSRIHKAEAAHPKTDKDHTGHSQNYGSETRHRQCGERGLWFRRPPLPSAVMEFRQLPAPPPGDRRRAEPPPPPSAPAGLFKVSVSRHRRMTRSTPGSRSFTQVEGVLNGCWFRSLTSSVNVSAANARLPVKIS